MNHEATIITEPRGLTLSQRIKDQTQKRRLKTLPGKLIVGNNLGPPEEYLVFFHGGAGAKDEEWYNLRLAGTRRAAQLGEKLITSGLYSPGDVAVQMAANAEYDVNLIAGIGSDKNRRGKYQFDAFSMDTGSLGIATAIGKVKNPVYAARLIQYLTDTNLITGEDATTFADEEGLTFYTTPELNAGFKAGAESRYKLYTPNSDTVGAIVAAKWNGIWDVAIAGTTGGMRKKRGGRVGDCGIIRAGFFVDRLINEKYNFSNLAAALVSGVGEASMHTGPAGKWVDSAIGSGTSSYHGINTVRSLLKTTVDSAPGWGALAGVKIYDSRDAKTAEIVILPTVNYFPYSAYSNLKNLYIEEVPRITDAGSSSEVKNRRIKVGTSLSSTSVY
jgi:isoaspartyl peptidase/L-asparaginase-like protein (Ntn-hydrolase superfamily)